MDSWGYEPVAQEGQNEQKLDIFVANSTYPDAHAVFTWRPEPLEHIKDDCIVVLDTNPLLVPYETSSKSLDEIRRTYEMLTEEGRLVIPGQAAREFADNRATKLTELYQQLSDKKSQAKALQMGRYPLLEGIDKYHEVHTLLAKINNTVDDYKKVVGQVMDHIQQWTWNDPVSLMYGELFGEKTVLDPTFDKSEMEKDLVWRQVHKIPPGYKDASKPNRGIGDILIWHTILKLGEERQKSVVFVSGDEKADWWHRGSGTNLYPRYELLDEYRRHAGGQSLYIMRLSVLLDLYGADKAVVQEVADEEQEAVDRVVRTKAPMVLQLVAEEAKYEAGAFISGITIRQRAGIYGAGTFEKIAEYLDKQGLIERGSADYKTLAITTEGVREAAKDEPPRTQSQEDHDSYALLLQNYESYVELLNDLIILRAQVARGPDEWSPELEERFVETRDGIYQSLEKPMGLFEKLDILEGRNTGLTDERKKRAELAARQAEIEGHRLFIKRM